MEPHPNLSQDIIDKITSAEGSIDVRDIPEGYALEVETRNTVYRIVDGYVTSEDRAGNFHGSNFGGSMFKPHHVWIGGHMEFNSWGGGMTTTTAVQRIDVVREAAEADRRHPR